MTELLGQPAHPFFVHLPIVLVPLVGLAAVALALRPSWRRRYGIALVGASALVLVATLLAVSSGEALDERLNHVEPVERHRELAETARLMVAGLFAATLALVLVGRRYDRPGVARAGWMPAAMVGLAGLTVLTAIGSTVWIARAGHEGSRVVWRHLDLDARPSAPTTTSAITSTTVEGTPPTTAAAATAAAATAAVDVVVTNYALDSSSARLKAGEVTFRVRNGEDVVWHEFVVMRGVFAELAKTANGAVDETKLAAGDLIGRVPGISPQTTSTVTYSLEPGRYVLVCNISVGPNSHARDGQRLDVTVE